MQRNLSCSLLAIFLCGCQQSSGVEGLRAELKIVGDKVARQKAENDRLQQTLITISNRLTRVQTEQARYQTLVFDPVANEGFSRLDTSVVSVIVAIHDIRPYADGTQVSLSVGNLSSATLSHVTGTSKFGPSEPQYDPKDENAFEKAELWEKTLRSKDFTVTGDLAAGTWNNVVLTLPGTKPSDFGHLELTLDVKTVSLRKLH